LGSLTFLPVRSNLEAALAQKLKNCIILGADDADFRLQGAKFSVFSVNSIFIAKN
jgi:hypothetical protein